MPAKRKSESSDVFSMLTDAVIIVLAFLFAMLIRVSFGHHLGDSIESTIGQWNSAPGAICLLLYISAFLWSAQQYGLYSFRQSACYHEISKICQACLNAFFVLSGVMFLAHAVSLSREVLIFLSVLTAIALSGYRCMRRCQLRSAHATSAIARNIAILGTNQLSYALSQQIGNRTQFNFVGFLEFPGCRFSPELTRASVVGEISDLGRVKAKCFLDAIVIAEFYSYDKTMELLRSAHELDLDVFSIAGYYDELTTNAAIQYLGLFPVSILYFRKSHTAARFLKRALDIAMSIAGLAIAALPMLVIALLIRLEGNGPVLYVADRIGRWGKPFRCLKFRTMVRDADAMQQSLFAQNERDSILFKLQNDPRITRIGSFLRKYSLDELPQLVNVLRGDMSMVGPRPPLPHEVASYSLEHLYRLWVMPGLTGLWQVQARQDNSFTKYIALDVAYVKNWSLLLDLKILLRTVDVVLRGTGV
ncbi:MAG TPA: sugar transferase [Terracidiphilus sp.]|nr:sugar transferase [Terracidiphilus sp.]